MGEWIIIGTMAWIGGFLCGFGFCVVMDEMGRGRFFDDAP